VDLADNFLRPRMIRDISLKTDRSSAVTLDFLSDLFHFWNQKVDQGNGKIFFSQTKGAPPPYAAGTSSY